MHYLSSSLKSRALETIANIAITADNFQVAWNTLKARFENKRRLLTNHLSTLLGLSALSLESASDLQTLYDKINIAVSSLRKLNRSPEDLWNDFLVHLLTQKLDAATRKAWNLQTSNVDSPPAFADLKKFVTSRIRALKECSSTSSHKPASKSANSPHVNVATASVNSPSACPLCKARHYLNLCPEFVAKNPQQRQEIVKRFKRCFNCMSSNHSVRDCKSKYACRFCNQRHHSMLHVDAETSSDSTTITPSASQASQSSTPKVEVLLLFAAAQQSRSSQVFLATAWIRVKVSSDRAATVRALLDQGSQATFISGHLAQSLYATRIRMSISISAVGGTHVGKVRHAASIIIAPRDSDNPSLCTTAYILDSLTAYTPRCDADSSCLAHLSDLAWADTNPSSSDPIHILIGADIYNDIIQGGVRKGEAGQPIAQETIFGWVISGPLVSDANSPAGRSSVNITVLHCTSLRPLAEEVQRFWEVEEISHTRKLTPQDEQCESHFCDTHSRQSDGRYIVRLPFKRSPPPEIGRSRLTAERLFNSLSRRFRSNSELEKDYDEFMREYETLGHMRRAPSADRMHDPCVYIPHHPVIRETSLTTRLRVVFNASSLTSNGTSSNDHLLAGPKLQTDLPAIILQWRQFKFVYTADIAKMYRQILIDPQDLDYQRILWKGDPSEGPVDYQLLTVTYGMNCAPYLALRTIQCLADDEGHRFPRAVTILRKQTYVDDVLFGGDDIALVRESRDQLVALLRCGKFELRKWASNSPILLADIDSSDHGLVITKQIAIDDQLKVLGIAWNPSRDVFQFKVSLGSLTLQSKRAILSAIARLYDPLGWVTPVTVSAKIIMQQLWGVQIEWDDRIPDSLLYKRSMIYAKLSHLNDLQISRWTGVTADASHAELHGFADASTLAYAAAVYLKVTSATGQVTISLLAGKSKIAPISPLTVPRLELSAALLLARLINVVRNSLSIKSIPVTCWTDSTIVLAWLRSHPSRWKVFVENRVHEIQSNLPDADWRYVPTQDNPADCASRGLYGDELLAHFLWWHGPSWLEKNKRGVARRTSV
ncbi:uncharacterized protein LOC112468697 [Temnothorax curvispinosus]|uniref:Uncharacterized protein LOC112468697 n=1 Tax=Temnothorax curvispinosus TaxID=300111 RepID=A0A6J1RHD6_9HYME|nr:uncharacterized protein LOC112468697 [Temnothorax curvispinosus]